MAAKKAKRHPAWQVLEVTAALVLGALLGSGLAAVGRAVGEPGPILAPVLRTWPIGLEPPGTVDLGIVRATLGFQVEVGVLTLLGAAAAVWLLLKTRR